MLDTPTLREILKDIFQVDDKYLIPMDQDAYASTIDPEDKTSTYITYRIMRKMSYARSYVQGEAYSKPIKVSFKISFIGPQAEALGDQVLLWDDRTDVQNAFESRGVQINYEAREYYSFPIKASGKNDRLAWVVDLECQTNYTHEVNYPSWFEEEVNGA